MNETEHLLVILGEESSEIGQRTSKAIRFGLSEIEPGQPEDNKRRLEREVADLIGMARMLGLEIREEDIVAKIEKVGKYMAYARQLGTLDDDAATKVGRICRGCSVFMPPGFAPCDGSGSHPWRGV